MTLNTTSIPFSSAPEYLNVHIPSFFTSQYAPEAECIPRLPAEGGVCVDEEDDGSSVSGVCSFVGSSEEVLLEGGACWTIVLFTLKR